MASNLRRVAANGPLGSVLAALLWVLAGVGLLPALIFLSGIALLGRYEGASLARTYSSIFAGLGQGSPAAWGVVLGPYVLFLLFKGLMAWWRITARWA
jgi:hypothetical protein